MANYDQRIVSPTDRRAAVVRMPFPHRLVTTEVEDGVAVVRIRREKASQSINPATLFQLTHAIESAEAAPSVRGIVITGTGAFFASGADLGFFVTALRQGDIPKIIEFTRFGNACFNRIEKCAKPIVAAINGNALGGGLELALACHYRIATRNASLGFPETSLGLIPGWGGIRRSQQLVGQGAAKWLVYTGRMLSTRDAGQLGAVDGVCAPDELLITAKNAATNGALATPPLPAGRSGGLPVPMASFVKCCEEAPVESLRSRTAERGGSREFKLLEKSLASKPALGLQYAEQLFAAASSLSPAEQEEISLRLVERLFHEHDTYRRLSNLYEKMLASGRVNAS